MRAYRQCCRKREVQVGIGALEARAAAAAGRSRGMCSGSSSDSINIWLLNPLGLCATPVKLHTCTSHRTCERVHLPQHLGGHFKERAPAQAAGLQRRNDWERGHKHTCRHV